ncbi:MAG: winged helix-turn-helix transcriptional regulator [archaeon]|nr:winged helix-turn-helix transcriptional regulator [archaeon]
MDKKINFKYRLLYQLSINSRISQKALAKKLKVSPQLVRYWTNKLEKEKIIQAYETQVDSAKFGLTDILVFMIFTTSDKKKQKKVTDYLIKSDNVTFIEKIPYGADLIIEYTVPNLSFFNKQHSTFLELFSQSTKVTEIFPVIVKHHLSKKYLDKKAKAEHSEILSGDRTPIILQENSKKVLSELCTNNTETIIRIAEKTNLDPRTVIKTKKELEITKIIRRYTITINYDKLNIKGCIILINFDYTTPKRINKIISYLHYIPEITTVTKILGKYQLMIRIETVSDYMPIIYNLRDKFKFYEFTIYRIGNIIKNTSIPISVLTEDGNHQDNL